MSYPWEGENRDHYIPMINFSMIESGLFRSGFPIERNRPFLKRLGIQTILYIQPKQEKSPHTDDLRSFCDSNNIRFIYSPFDSDKFASSPDEVNQSLSELFSIILDRRNYPMLINCLKGQHYTGMLVACLRRLQQWSLSSIFMEFAHYEKKVQAYDFLAVELFKVHVNVNPAYLPRWITQREIDENNNR